jgi:hypothetical protein
MSQDWVEEALNTATGNFPVFEEFLQDLHVLFKKLRDNGYPDMVIVSVASDVTKLPMTIPQLFDAWRSEQK